MKAPPRVVLDTNVVLSVLLVGGGPPAQVRPVPVVSVEAFCRQLPVDEA